MMRKIFDNYLKVLPLQNNNKQTILNISLCSQLKYYLVTNCFTKLI